jgi:mycoredoxin
VNSESQINQSIIVYGHNRCPLSRLLAKSLKKHNVGHEWRDVHQTDQIFAEELRQLANGYLSVPTVIFPDGTVMVEPWPTQVLRKINIEPTGWLEKLVDRLQKKRPVEENLS